MIDVLVPEPRSYVGSTVDIFNVVSKRACPKSKGCDPLLQSITKHGDFQAARR